MDQDTNKRRTRVVEDVKKRHGAYREADDNMQLCTKIGCNGRIKYAQSTKLHSYYRPSSSTSTSMASNPEKLLLDSKGKLPSQLKYDHSRSRSTDSEFASSTESKSESDVDVSETRISRASLNAISRITLGSNQSTLVSSAASSSRSSNLQPSSSGVGKFGLGNLKSSSEFDSLQSYSSRGSKFFGSKSKKKRSVDVESSSDKQFMPSSSTLTISGLRNKGNSASSSHGSSSSSSFGGKMLTNKSGRVRPQKNDGKHSAAANPTTSSEIPSTEVIVGQRSLSSTNSRLYSLARHSEPSAMSLSRTRGSIRLTPTNRDFFHQYDINGAAEMLLALERIEQDEDASPEQVILEMSLFLSSLSIYDQHQDLRLDIDNMSYEELLALEERMGTVSTPLTEEELSKCLKISFYQQTSTLQSQGFKDHSDDTKCSICQEDYVIGEKIGMISTCSHRYHEMCVSQWLRLKNWCPICKTSAAASQPSPSM